MRKPRLAPSSLRAALRESLERAVDWAATRPSLRALSKHSPWAARARERLAATLSQVGSAAFVLRPSHDWQGFVDFELRLSLEDERYDYSKLYYAFGPSTDFGEDRVICFRAPWRDRFVPTRLLLPVPPGGVGTVRLRLDAIPYSAGRFSVRRVGLVRGRGDEARSRQAETMARKERVRAQVQESEATGRATLPHYPESLSLELTTRCNLTCGHCSSHGVPEAHALNARGPALDEARLERLAEEVFPHLTLVNLVGRGEPTMVADHTWSRLVGLLEQHGVLLSCVSNGSFLERRLDDRTMARLDTLTISIDGLTAATLAENRGGASLERILAGVRHFHRARQRLGLARRPRLGFSWTLKRNNIAEFPGFVRFIRQFEPDVLYVRHLLVFHEKDRDQSLLGHAELTNRYLAEAYAELRTMQVKADVPPLMAIDPPAPPLPGAPSTGAARDATCLFIHRTGVVMADGEVVVCANMYAEHAGRLAEGTRFLDVWNGDALASVRRALGTAEEWSQCRSCWYRESRYHAQRAAWSARSASLLDQPVQYSPRAWDFRAAQDGSRAAPPGPPLPSRDAL